jgi:amino acid transporter
MADRTVGVKEPARVDDLGLRTKVLGGLPVLGQSIAGIGPTIGAVSLIALVFADAGHGTWLTVVIASIGILAVAICIAHVAGSHFSSGALYNLVPKGLGTTAGFVTGWITLLMMVCSGPFLFTGFAQYLMQFLSATGIAHLSSSGAQFTLEIACLIVCTAIALLDIRISTRLFLIIEGASMAAILVLLVIVVAKVPSVLDHNQFSLRGATTHGVILGMVFMILAFGGFEGSTVLGLEAKDPRRALRLAVIGSVVVVAIFFLLNAYVQVLGFDSISANLGTQSAPLSTLASHNHVSWLGDLILLGVTVSFFAAANATLNYGPRVLFTMAHDGLLPMATTNTNRRGAPYRAILCYAIVWLAVLTYVLVSGVAQGTAFGDLGSLAGNCGTLIYLLASLAAPVWAYRRGAGSLFIAGAGLVGAGVMGVVFYYSLVPFPTGSARVFAFLFFGAVVLLFVIGIAARLFRPQYLQRVGSTEVTPTEG